MINLKILRYFKNTHRILLDCICPGGWLVFLSTGAFCSWQEPKFSSRLSTWIFKTNIPKSGDLRYLSVLARLIVSFVFGL